MATALVYGNHPIGQYSATAARRVNWTGDTIVARLHTSTYAPNQDTHVFQSDLTNELATGSGYTSGGATLASKSVTYDSATNETRLTAGAVVWPSSTLTARFASVSSNAGGSAATNPLIAYVNFGTDQSTSSGNFTITWASDGVFKLAAA